MIFVKREANQVQYLGY